MKSALSIQSTDPPEGFALENRQRAAKLEVLPPLARRVPAKPLDPRLQPLAKALVELLIADLLHYPPGQ